ncbi:MULTISPECIES: acyl-CoA carboxylase subunit epsilon [Streptomyces]|uniref:acyl-CoA carboxylase subunit epsilon n=1 Tax=Streptomyces TaxID=1883 RepID=UPI0033A4B725
MGTPEHHEPVLRVERGQAGDEELAALTVVLLALRAGGVFPGRGRPVNGSRWWRPRTRRAPRSWQ